METGNMVQEVIFRDLGLIDYREAWEYQEKLLRENIQFKSQSAERKGLGILSSNQSTTHYLIFCEHPPVYTLGKSGHSRNLLASPEQLDEQGIQFVETNRGGDITFHGPGQVVGYPIMDLERFRTDIGYYLRSLEEVIIRTLDKYAIKGERSPGLTGVWLDAENPGKARKICAMGVRCSRWITMHGFAFNVNTDLHYFNGIIPCGIAGGRVTSLQRELGTEVPMAEVKRELCADFEQVFGAHLVSDGV
ncbi:MAG TPA: lipoyl(octanoyl) transferase LipB [Chitinophagaceae bacterium]|nr:lipoyl(octanoyl) transferase LipB [Chitinophagaceae bacterium]